MRVVLLRTTNGLFHRWVRETTLNAHNHGLVLLVAYDNAMQCTLRHLEPLIPSISTWRALRRTGALLRRNRLHARDVAPDDAHASRILELTGGPLKAQIELLLL